MKCFALNGGRSGAGQGHHLHQTLGRGAQNGDAVMKCFALNGGRGGEGQGLEVKAFDIKRCKDAVAVAVAGVRAVVLVVAGGQLRSLEHYLV